MPNTSQHSLQAGSSINDFKIIRVLGAGGFGITYLAEDTKSNSEVVIKEYFPNELAIRNFDSSIVAKTDALVEFTRGLERFKEEAKTLIQFNHHTIVKILGYFEANKTAYFVMKYEGGIDLDKYMQKNKPPFTQEEIITIIMPILEGLKEVHKYNYLHRDIKPGNILLRDNNDPVLIDFGASKMALGDVSKSITTILTMGYAPPEQYSSDVKKQGAFTDLYSIAAVMHKMITGDVPPDAQTRVYALVSKKSDPYKPLSRQNLSGYDNYFLKAIDKALDIDTQKRPQNVQEFQKNISGEVNAFISQPTQMIKDGVYTGYKPSGIFSIDGRINRLQYWLYSLIPIALILVASFMLVGTISGNGNAKPIGSILFLGAFIISIWISIAIQVKRWHDLDQSGWWSLLGFIPYLNIIVLILLGFIKGTDGVNRFGVDPLGNNGVNNLIAKVEPSEENNDNKKLYFDDSKLNNNLSITLLGMGNQTPPIILNRETEIIVGRSRSADISINNKYISGKHLIIRLDDDGRVQVKDLNSSNGTYIDGRKLDVNIFYELRQGDKLLIASEDVIYTL